ncbi:MAG: hypothetical protein ACKONH_03810 [Planctomycetia bacterium]
MLRRARCAAIWMLLMAACGAVRGDDASVLVPDGATVLVPGDHQVTAPDDTTVPPPDDATVLVPDGTTVLAPEEGSLVFAGPTENVVVPRLPLGDPGRPQAYAIADAVFLQRDNQSTDQPLVISGSTALITTHQLTFATQPGLRAFFGAVNECDAGWEVGYLGVWNMFASSMIAGPDTLQAPDPLALLVPEFNDRGLARATYASTLNSAEISVFSRADDGGYCRGAAAPWQRCAGYSRGTFDWLAGVRWAGLDESASLIFSGGGNPALGSYSLRSTTNLFGGQVGGRGRMEWERWAFEGWAKVALCGSAMSQSQAPIVNAAEPDPPVRPARHAFEGGVGFIGDLNATLAYRLTDTWALRAGYNLVWLTGVALAPTQFDFGRESTSGSGLNGGAGVFLHGANLGLEARW